MTLRLTRVRSKMQSDQTLSNTLDAIEAELRTLGYAAAASAEPDAVTAAFGSGTLAFEDWLARVFLPNARHAIATDTLPAVSQVGVAAVRNFDGRDALDTLCSLLGEFDRLVAARARAKL